MKIAIVYDRINKIGGAERVLISLNKIWPEAEFFTAVYNSKTAPFAKKWKINSSFMQYVPLAKTNHELFPWLTPFAFESFDFNQFDIVISITSAEAKGIITQPKTLHICYCLTPTRYLYSHKNHYIQSGPKALSYPKRFFINKLRIWDQVAATRPDHYISISKTVQKRIKKYYKQDSQIIYPPTDSNSFKPHKTKSVNQGPGYFLIVSRLVSYKNIDIAIKAFNRLSLPLKIIGTGSQQRYLKKLAGPTIEFLGKVSDQELLKHYQNATALIFPGVEDFGLTMVEALYCGIPVIGLNQGGASEIVTHGQNGLLFDKLTVSDLARSVKALDSHSFKRQQLRSSAIKYSDKTFKQEFENTINKLWASHKKQQI